MNLAVIPARGGSKRIPRKNIKLFCGKPIIVWSIEAAIKSSCFDHVIVSTDDSEIAEIAIQHGAEVPFVRPLELSDDYVGTIPVIKHAVEWFKGIDNPADFTCCIYATAPFIRAADLQKSIDLIRLGNVSYVFSITAFPFPIQRALTLNGEGCVQMLQPEHYHTRSQDLPETYHDAGQFYCGRSSAWLEELPIFNSKSLPIVLPRYRVCDIDTIEDWKRAELMFRALRDG